MGKIKGVVLASEESWNDELSTDGRQICDRFLAEASRVILNKKNELRLALICFLAEGHLLIEDIPGVGKTTFVKTVGQLLGLHFGRIQFTSDLLPSDILGTSIYDPEAKKFRFHKGPIFAELVLIDELNRATPKTQSALLQAMEEKQVTVDSQTIALPDPFFLVATQNPRFQVGTFSLPESQLDRFMMRIQLGYPGVEAEKALLLGDKSRDRLNALKPFMSPEQLRLLREEAAKIHLSEEIARYVQQILENSRKNQKDIIGLSPRAGLSLVAAAKVAAFLEGRQAVFPEDVQAVALAVINHRLSHVDNTFQNSASLTSDLVNSVEID